MTPAPIAIPPAAAPHVRTSRSVRAVMAWVLIALLPVYAVQSALFGPGLWIQFLLALVAALLAEAIALTLRKQPVQPALTDGSAALTAALLALCMPPLAPWWLVTSASAFAILLGKHVYGGLGMNLFNPAMLGYAVLIVSFPKAMTAWPPVTAEPVAWLSSASAIITGTLPDTLTVDVLSGASPLAAIKSGLSLRLTMDEIRLSPIFSSLAGTGWDWVSISALGGGILLLGLRIIRWQIPVAMLLGLSLTAMIVNWTNPGDHAGPVFHLLSGASMVGAFFIATDPVTAATSPRGRLIYGAGIGMLTYIIREFGQYHDGLAFAVLLMNMTVPLIDKFTIPRIHGEIR